VALTEQELEHLERLARLKLSGRSREKLREQLARIIEFVTQLQKIDTAGIEPSVLAGAIEPALRPDEVKPCLPRDEVLSSSPQNRGGFFAVPPVIDADGL
jgi:aspartyl-tRNA(Asn)/glutamyl-tRNA(Gln) amidotransferase subunit C